jgi:ParB family transcriptional regulator, chromosome partitioning protein
VSRPKTARGTKWTPDQLAAALEVDDAELEVLSRWTPPASETVTVVPAAEVRPSPFQPRGRPSVGAVAAVSEAIARAGSLAALVDDASAHLLQGLDGEARALAELAADVAEHGVESALEVRRVEGGLELLSGHRRLAAARLAGAATVPVIDRGAMPDHLTAAIVYRRNLLRKDFTAWQEAVSFAAIQRNRRAAGLPDSVRAVARALGSSHGRAGDLLSIARAFPPELLAELGDGDPELAEEALARLSFRLLRELAGETDTVLRVAAARQATGLGPAPVTRRAESAVWEFSERRGGGASITLRRPPERMTVTEARDVLTVLEEQVARLRARVARG